MLIKSISFSALLLCVHIAACAQTQNDSSINKWTGEAEGDYYFVPGENLPPTITIYADRSTLHLEARYNYEDVNSYSVFAGRNFEKIFKKGDVTITPMAGVVVGHSNGFLPGLECSLSYADFNFYTENEYMLNFKGKEADFFYSWTELNKTVIKNLRAGILAQSLRWFATKFDIQRGIYAEYNRGCFTFDAYYFNPFTNANFAMASVNISF